PVAFSNAANLIANVVYIAVTLLLYQIFKPVSRNLALLAVAISVVGCIVQSLSLFHIGPRQDALPIFGFFNLTIGYLIVRSTFLPRALGVLMAVSGLGWLTVLSPELVKHVGVYVEVIGIAAEGFLMLWLLVMGVDVQRWREQAATSSSTSPAGTAQWPRASTTTKRLR
ncbi:MAG: DUF4386 domain-containing protein, partial [Candidatus Eremiobacteraeota bacterium]|nr:DUF4386 domain-containing protein [Candidatus Eremiobacteraeota bacterium]